MSFDLFTVSVQSIEGTAAENSTFATPRDTTTGQIFSINNLHFPVLLQTILVRIIPKDVVLMGHKSCHIHCIIKAAVSIVGGLGVKVRNSHMAMGKKVSLFFLFF